MTRVAGPDFAEGNTRPTSQDVEEYFLSSPGSLTDKLASFPKFADRSSLARFLVKYEIFKQIQSVPGSIVECGVNLGGGLFTWAQLSAIAEPLNHRRHVIGFDTFSGFPSVSEVDVASGNDRSHVGGVTGGALADLEHARALYDADRPLNHIPKVHLVAGDFLETGPAWLAANPHAVISLLYLDFDIYAPTKAAIETFLPRIPRGGIIAFDELHAAEWPGETQAVADTIGFASLRWQRLPFTSICWGVVDGPRS